MRLFESRFDDAIAEEVGAFVLLAGVRRECDIRMDNALASAVPGKETHGAARRRDRRLIPVGRHMADVVNHASMVGWRVDELELCAK